MAAVINLKPPMNSHYFVQIHRDFDNDDRLLPSQVFYHIELGVRKRRETPKDSALPLDSSIEVRWYARLKLL